MDKALPLQAIYSPPVSRGSGRAGIGWDPLTGGQGSEQAPRAKQSYPAVGAEGTRSTACAGRINSTEEAQGGRRGGREEHKAPRRAGDPRSWTAQRAKGKAKAGKRAQPCVKAPRLWPSKSKGEFGRSLLPSQDCWGGGLDGVESPASGAPSGSPQAAPLVLLPLWRRHKRGHSWRVFTHSRNCSSCNAAQEGCCTPRHL